MSSLEEATRPRGAAGLIHRLSGALGSRVRRRDVFVGAAVAGSALATDPKAYALLPQSAYATICGPGNTAASGWTVFCCTINDGVNACPPGSFAAGWWKAADSSWCGGGYRYIVDCNARCTKCSTGCSDGICDNKCWNCSCGKGSTDTCDQRRVCCNAFRYGQCNTHVKCSGGVHCRVVTCEPPYRWANCTTTSLRDDRTAEHSAPCIPAWGPIQAKYKAMGGPKSYLNLSAGPIRTEPDGRGSRVEYRGGAIYHTSDTGAQPLNSWVLERYLAAGGPAGRLGYPIAPRTTLPDGWISLFEHGCVVDSVRTTTQIVSGWQYDRWVDRGRESGVLGYPKTGVIRSDDGWIQIFEHGCLTDSVRTTTMAVIGWRWTKWQEFGRETGVLGYPTTELIRSDDGWIQVFEHGCLTDSVRTTTQVVLGELWQAWDRSGRGQGVLGYPRAAAVTDVRGTHQVFERGELWALTGAEGHWVLGGLLDAWAAEGGASGPLGYPVSDTSSDGTTLTCTFEGGTLTAPA